MNLSFGTNNYCILWVGKDLQNMLLIYLSISSCMLVQLTIDWMKCSQSGS
jgi:hypothetical protein